nr:immunoglobulin heavy chain junction region [Macaca mulatta]MOX40665.1 immunoglobulin heavy chain junction region [Macaca mulatta]MOX41028.1 immunoglobulin heavy chain junction region [Macaca mulatta]MOX41167.1 immunoglobulin heavy chain junction region [Macaca mulatta]
CATQGRVVLTGPDYW